MCRISCDYYFCHYSPANILNIVVPGSMMLLMQARFLQRSSIALYSTSSTVVVCSVVKPERVHVRLGGAALHQEQCRGAGAASASGGAHGQRREQGLTEAHAEAAGRSRRDAHAARGVHRTLRQGPRAPAASPSSPYAPPESAFLPPRLLFLRVSRRILYILVRRSVYDVLVYSTL